MKLSEIKANPNNPRIIKDAAFKKLVKSIQEFPKMMELRPMVVNADGVVLGGNMRLKALKELGFTEIPDGWVKRAEDLTEEEIRKFIILDNASFGEWEFDLLMSDWSREELEDWGVEVPEDWGEKENEENPYTKKIQTPVYEVKGEKPVLNSLFDRSKYDQLVAEINKSQLSDIEKDFLKIAASRHIVFNYENIADYYAHSEIETQKHFEDSALVIIDFEKAIEDGYVRLSEEIKSQYLDDYENGE